MERKIISEDEAKLISPITLAFVGDAVCSLYSRLKNVFSGDYKAGELNRRTASEVCAVSQAARADVVATEFTEAEAEIYRRAKNAHKPSHAKHSTALEYSKSTGLEAVIGFLYLTGDDLRLSHFLSSEVKANAD